MEVIALSKLQVVEQRRVLSANSWRVPDSISGLSFGRCCFFTENVLFFRTPSTWTSSPGFRGVFGALDDRRLLVIEGWGC